MGKEGGVQEQEAMMLHLERMALESSREVRELMGMLESPALCWPEWLAGLRHHAAQTCEAAGIHLEWLVAGQEQAGETADQVALSSLLRAVTEALHNLVRHSGARHARMEITLSAEEVCLRLQDDGRGYAGLRAGGRGMGNMRRRVEEMGGKLQIESSALDAAAWSLPQPGTRLTFNVPLPLNCG
jgi:signal transduction histidine kinase